MGEDLEAFGGEPLARSLEKEAVLEAAAREGDAGRAGEARDGGDAVDEGVVEAGRAEGDLDAARAVLEESEEKRAPVQEGGSAGARSAEGAKWPRHVPSCMAVR